MEVADKTKPTLKCTLQMRELVNTANCALFNFCLLLSFCAITEESLEWIAPNLKHASLLNGKTY